MENDNILDYTEESFDINNVDDVSDVYSEENFIDELEEIIGSEAESSAPSDDGISTFDDSNIISSLADINTSIELTNEKLEHTNHRLDQTYDIVIAIVFLLAGFVTISIFKKLFDWLV